MFYYINVFTGDYSQKYKLLADRDSRDVIKIVGVISLCYNGNQNEQR